MNKKETPLIVSIGNRSLLAPAKGVYIGVGNRQVRYEGQLDNYLLPMIMAAGYVDGVHKEICTGFAMKYFETASYLSSVKADPMVSTHTLLLLSRLLDAVINGKPHRVMLNFHLPKGVHLNVEKAVIGFVQHHADFFKALYVACYAPSEPAVAVEIKPEVTEEPLYAAVG